MYRLRHKRLQIRVFSCNAEAALSDYTQSQPLCFDSHAKDWRKLERKEFIRLFHLETLKPSQTRGRRKNFF